MNYKETLNLPKTEFPMKANLSKNEPGLIRFWDKIGLYEKLIQNRSEQKTYILHDGPPYANGDIHVGHVFNKVLKDLIVKYKYMTGYYSPYVPGWDCHGQPIEHEVEIRLGKEKEKITQVVLRKKCRDYALKFVKRQTEQFKRIGVIGDFKNPYLTLDPNYEAVNIEVFGELFERGLIYKGKKPIHWCYSCMTALAEAEIEYSDEKSPSIYVKFPIKEKIKDLESYAEPKFILIWTTTPWTLPANVAVALHPKATYRAVSLDGEIFIMASDLVERVMEETGFKDYELLVEIKSKKLENLNCRQPLQDWDSRITLADFVSLDQGTGCVHIAPGHGQEDYMLGLKYDLSSPVPVDNTGRFTDEAGIFAGNHILKGNELIIDYLDKQRLLFYSSDTVHSYPHCWRCKKPVIFRATEQWFVSMDTDNYRSENLSAIENVEWIPEWNIKRISAMISERPDWCLSRQRAWGVPLPVFFCIECGKEVVNKESINRVAELFRRKGADSWFEIPADEILPSDFKCPYCQGSSFEKENDILDVWFESGVSHFAVLRGRPELRWPSELYLEGSDQHRGWFQSSLLTSVGVEGIAPYKSVLTHGFTVDEEGRKMSKSLGNVIDPLKVIEKSGADILRLWVVSADYSSDIAISQEILARISEAYRRIRNTIRFLLGNTYDFDPGKNSIIYEELIEIDKWALHRLQNLIMQITDSYENYQFYQVYHTIYNYCVTELSSFYLDILKDVLYTSASDWKIRRSAQTVLYQILYCLIKVVAPILAFTAEEAWQQRDEFKYECESVHLSDWPKAEQKFINQDLDDTWNKLIEVRGEVSKCIESLRESKVIGNSLQVEVIIYAGSNLYSFLKEYKDRLAGILIVSQVSLEKYTPDFFTEDVHISSPDELAILCRPSKNKKCERCWNYFPSVGEIKEHPNICERCARAVKDMD